MMAMLLVAVSLALPGLGAQVATAKDTVAKITKEELKARLDDPSVVIVDVRLGKDWKASEVKIKRAIRVDAADVLTLAEKYPKDQMLVFYCA
jgi:rhodanese-related sulfurtransferase